MDELLYVCACGCTRARECVHDLQVYHVYLYVFIFRRSSRTHSHALLTFCTTHIFSGSADSSTSVYSVLGAAAFASTLGARVLLGATAQTESFNTGRSLQTIELGFKVCVCLNV